MKRQILHLLYQIYQLYLAVRQPVTLGVSALVIDTQNRVLLVRHSYVQGWHLPGGKVEKFESVAEAVQRELQEEVGVETEQAPQFWGLYYNPRRLRSDHIAVFLIRDFKISPQPNFEIERAEWFDVKGLPEQTSLGTRLRIQEWLGAARSSDWLR